MIIPVSDNNYIMASFLFLMFYRFTRKYFWTEAWFRPTLVHHMDEGMEETRLPLVLGDVAWAELPFKCCCESEQSEIEILPVQWATAEIILVFDTIKQFECVCVSQVRQILYEKVWNRNVRLYP